MNKDKEKMRTPPMLAHQFNPSAPHNMTSEFVSALKNYKNNVVNRMEIVNNKEFGKFLHQFIDDHKYFENKRYYMDIDSDNNNNNHNTNK